jgi:hexosaminidase
MFFLERFFLTSRIAIAFILASIVLGAVIANADEKPLSLVPLPLKVERKIGAFIINKDTTILVAKDSADAAHVGKLLAERLKKGTGFDLKVATTDETGAVGNAIVIRREVVGALRNGEKYSLTVTPDGIVITAQGGAGLFYGTQTLLQLLPPEIFGDTNTRETTKAIAWTVPCVDILDQPRFQWRGLMLDVSRHFFNKEDIKQFLDLMAQHKLNTFHWHLVDDQGWRIEIKKYPKLTEVGAWRKGIGFRLDPKAGIAYGPDGRYGGFFTQDDVREIVAYAKDRYITIVPEIEMPGHSAAALTAYPEYSCTGHPSGVYCAGNDATFEFLQNVLAEVIELFPSKYVHIGGDEVDKANWKKCPKCQARIKKENLKNEHELQSYFVRRVEKYLNSKGRTLIGWDEILEGGLAPNATVMSWRGAGGGIAAANAGHDVVMTPTSHCYFDYYQANKDGEPKAIGGFVPLATVYSFEPIPAKIAPDKATHVLGAGGNLWSEYFPNFAHVQYMAYPRACAAAEVDWTDPKLKNWADFRRRLEVHLERLKAQGVNYREPRPTDPK